MVALLVALAAVAVTTQAWAQDPETVASVAMYRGPDRMARLVDGARREGALMIYTSMDLQESRPLIEAFMRTYPFIRVDLYRSTGEDVAQRVISEYRGRRFAVDVIEGTGTDVAKVINEGIGRTFHSPRTGGYAKQSRDPRGFWVATRYNMLVMAWHTSEIASAEAPASYEDLLNPKFKGKIGMEADDQIWLAALMEYWGEPRGLAFFRRLGDQNLSWRRGHTLLAQLIVAGEVSLSPTIYNHRAESLRVRGAPIEWRPLEPVVAFPNTVTLARRAPHPHAAMLFIDYLLAPEGQQVLARLGRIPAHPFVKADPPYLNQGFVFRAVDPQRFLRDYAKYNRLWQELLVRTR